MAVPITPDDVIAARPPIAIRSHSVTCALGTTQRALVRALRESRSGLGASPYELPFETVTGTIPDPLEPLPSALAGHESRAARIALMAFDGVAAAVARAAQRYGSDRIALILGTSTGGLDRSEWAFALQRRNGVMPSDYDFERQHAFHALTDLLAARAQLTGPRYVVSTACSSAAKTFSAAARLLELGVVDAVLAGGVDALCETTLRGFHALGILSRRACRPFATDRDGMNIGEGGALFLLERGDDAPIVLRGYGESSDAYHMSSPEPTGSGASAAIRQALARAGLDASEVDHVNAHGTGTKQNDAAEAQALHAIFGRSVSVASTKGFTGHLLGAAGAVEAVIAMACIEHGFVPASLGASPADPTIELQLSEQMTAQRVRVVASNSFAFGGSNAALIFGAPP